MSMRSICLVWALTSVFAQAQTRLGLSLGGDFGSAVGFRGGLPLENPLSSVFSLRQELSFTQRQVPAVLQNLDRERRYFSATTGYVELPLLVKAELRLQSWSLFGLFGPSVGFGMRATAWYREMGRLHIEKLNWGEADLRRFDFGLFAGLGGQKTLPDGYVLFLDFRYYLGLLNLNLRPEGAAIYHQGKAFTLGFLIPLKRKTGTDPE